MSEAKKKYKGFFMEQMAEAKAAAAHSDQSPLVADCPRLMFSGVAADSGTTAVHLAFLAACKRAGVRVQPFHASGSEQEAVLQAFVSGRLPRVLDDWLLDQETLHFLLAKHSEDTSLSTMEGAGGFFDGLYADEAARLGEVEGVVPTGSAASLALRMGYPVVLVLRPRGSKQSVLAELLGYLKWYEEALGQAGSASASGRVGSASGWSVSASGRSPSGIQGLIFNEVAASIYPELKTYIEEHTHLRVLGYLPPLPAFSLKLSTRALGDHSAPVWPKLRKSIDILAEAGGGTLDMEGLLALAREATVLRQETPSGLLSLQRNAQALGSIRIGVALDRCFFSYNQDNLELLAESGAKLLPFSLLEDALFPADMDALYLGGLYCPEMLPLLSHKGRLVQQLRFLVESGLPIWAEGQGAAYMSCNYYGLDGTRWLMSGALPYDAVEKLSTYQSLYSAQVQPLQLGAEFEPWEEDFLNQDEDLDNPRGISTWQVPYAVLTARGSGLLLGSGDSLRVLGNGQLTRTRASSDFQMATAYESSFLTGVNREHLHVVDARVLLYSAPEMVLRFMRAACGFRDRGRRLRRGSGSHPRR